MNSFFCGKHFLLMLQYNPTYIFVRQFWEILQLLPKIAYHLLGQMRKANPKKGYFFNLTNMRTHLNLPVALQNYALKATNESSCKFHTKRKLFEEILSNKPG